MTIGVIDSFNYNGTPTNSGLGMADKYTIHAIRVATDLTIITGRWGGNSKRFRMNWSDGNGSYLQMSRSLGFSGSSFSVNFSFRINNLNMTAAQGVPTIIVAENTTPHIGLLFSSDGKVAVYRQTSFTTGGTLLGTGDTSRLISANGEHYIEFSGTIHDTTGSYTVKVDGVTVLSDTNKDTRNGGTGIVDTMRWFMGGAATQQSLYTVDIGDLYTTNGASLGQMRADAYVPTSDVAQGFTRSAGSTNYTLVDELPPNGDTDYVTSATSSTVDTYGFTDLSSTPASIAAVQLTAFAKKTDAATRSIYLQAKSGGTTSDGPSYAMTAAYQKCERIMETDPNTSSAWTASAVNALQGGPKVV